MIKGEAGSIQTLGKQTHVHPHSQVYLQIGLCADMKTPGGTKRRQAQTRETHKTPVVAK